MHFHLFKVWQEIYNYCRFLLFSSAFASRLVIHRKKRFTKCIQLNLKSLLTGKWNGFHASAPYWIANYNLHGCSVTVSARIQLMCQMSLMECIVIFPLEICVWRFCKDEKRYFWNEGNLCNNYHWGHVFTVESFYDAVDHGPSSWFIHSVCLVSS